MTEFQQQKYSIGSYHVYVSVQSDVSLILSIIDHDEYCVIIGPRHCGKSELLRDVASRLRSDLTCQVVMINCYRLQSATEELVFASIAREIIEQLELAVEQRFTHQMPETPISFRRFAQDVADYLEQRLILFIDHLSAIPRHHARSLLSSLRAAYMERTQDSLPLVVVVASSLNLAELTVGRTSPFRNIARRIIIDDLDEEDTHFVVRALLQEQGVKISAGGMKRLVKAIGGDRALILRIAEECAQLVAGHQQPKVTTKTVERVVDNFLSQDAQDFRPLKEMAELIGQDWEVLQNVRDILSRGVIPYRELLLPSNDEVNPTFLSGAVRLVPGDEPAYAIKNEICGRFLADYFDPARVSDIYARSGRRQDAIEILVQAVKEDHTRYHEPLSDAVINAVYAAESLEQASRILAENMPHLFKVQQIQVFVRDLEAADLILQAEAGLSSGQSRRTPLSEDHTLEVMSFYDDGESVRTDRDGNTVFSIPLKGKRQTDIPLGVVLIHQFVGHSDFAERRLDIYQIRRFIREAARAMENVYTRCRQEAMLNRRSRVLNLLQHISSHIQLITNLDVSLNLILTGVTAHYGLRFNRAMLYLLDEPVSGRDKRLIGRIGIGQLEKFEAEAVWDRVSNMTFEDYVLQIQVRGIDNTGIDERVRSQSIPLDEQTKDAFSIVVLKGQAVDVKDPRHDLPPTFYQAFQPTRLLAVPLQVPGRVTGLLAADKKFTGALIESDDMFLLQAFANQAAAVVESERVHRNEAYIERLTRLHQMMRSIIADLDRLQVIRRITDCAVKLIGAPSAAFYQLKDGDFQLAYYTPVDPTKAIKPYPLAIEPGFVKRLPVEPKIQSPGDFEQASSVFGQDYASLRSRPAAFICRWLIAGDQPLGLLCIEYPASQWFGGQDRSVLDLFMEQATIALQNADYVAELTWMKDELASSEALEQMSLIGAKWHHDLRQKTFAMLGNVDMLAEDLVDDPEAQEMLDEIRQAVTEIRRIPIPLDQDSAPARKKWIELDPLLKREVTQYCRHYPDMALHWDLQCGDTKVSVDEERFGAALEIIIQNAAKAMDGLDGRLTICSYLLPGYAQVIVQDTGRGISEEWRDIFLKRRIHRKADESGTGVGGLIARRALQSFGAELKLLNTGPQGTTLAITLLLASQREE